MHHHHKDFLDWFSHFLPLQFPLRLSKFIFSCLGVPLAASLHHIRCLTDVCECAEHGEKKRNLQQHPLVQIALKCVFIWGSWVGAWGCLGITWYNCRVSRGGVTAHLATRRQVGTDDNKRAGRMRCMFTQRFFLGSSQKEWLLSPVVTVLCVRSSCSSFALCYTAKPQMFGLPCICSFVK